MVRSTGSGIGRMRITRPILLLVLAVLVPTACVLWLISDGIRNQRLVLRQKLAETYSSQLSLVRDRLDADWGAKAAALDSNGADATVFAQIVNSGMADSAIIRDSA